MSFEVALVPAAGRGARLDRSATPKPLVHIDGKPMILRVLSQLQAVGVRRAVVVIGYEGRRIARELSHHPNLSIEVEFVENPHWQRGLSSSVLCARKHTGDKPFVMCMADHVVDPELVKKITRTELGNDALAVLVDRELAGRSDLAADLTSAVKVATRDDRLVLRGRDIASHDAIDAGLFAATPALYDALERACAGTGDAAVHRFDDLSAGINLLAAAGKVRVVDTEGYAWFDVDTPRDVIRAEMKLRGRRRTERSVPRTVTFSDSPYSFTTGAPSSTRIFLERGFVHDPSRIDFIPADSASSPLFVITDTRVNELYGMDFVRSLRSLGYQVHPIVMAQGEQSKTLGNYTRLVEEIFALGIDERSILISLGGGAVCNVCGLLAATLYRGIGLIHIPTTLMAQCDAAISHKQGVNGARGKNLVGAYYAPMAIVVDTDVLATLDDWLIPDGLAEVVKHALGQDKGYLDYLLGYAGNMRDPDFLDRVVRKNIELKCQLMAVDPKEHREGMVLQYGHTVGHPIEHLSGYAMSHGQSVAVGMMVAAHTSRILGGAGQDVVDLHRSAMTRYRLPIAIPDTIQDSDIIDMLKYNKRYLTEGTRMALVDGPGHLWSVDGDYAIPVGEDVLRLALTATRNESHVFLQKHANDSLGRSYHPRSLRL